MVNYMKRHPRGPLILFLLAFLACTPAEDSPATSAPRGFLTTLDTLVPTLQQPHDIPGVAIALIENGTISGTAEFGYADQASATSVSATTVFNVGSVSKSVAAWGVLHQHDAGLLDLDAPIHSYLSRWSLPEGQQTPAITARRLLTHTAGLSVHGYMGQVAGTRLWTLEESLTGQDTIVDMFRPDSLYDGTGGVRVILPPGTQWRYSGGGYQVLQLAMEEISGVSFAEYMTDNVFEPLGMENTSYALPAQMLARAATPYSRGQAAPYRLFTAQAAAGLFTTASDLARLVAASMTQLDPASSEAAVLRPETKRQMRTSQPQTIPNRWSNAGWGLGVGLDKLANGTEVVWHGGDNIGWAARWVTIPNTSAGIVVLTNSDAGNMLIEEVVCRWLDWAAGDTFENCG